MTEQDKTILKVDNLHLRFEMKDETIHCLKGLSFEVKKGETLALVGESGSGKSVTAMSIMQLLQKNTAKYDSESSIKFMGEEMLNASEKTMNEINGNRICMIFQEPMTSLNPYMTIGDQLMEVLLHHRNMKKIEARDKTIELLTLVEMPNPSERLGAFPHEFSGGQLQRIMIAMALANEPELLIADEPTTALDVTIQAQVLELLQSIQKRMGMAILFVTHDLGIVKHMTDRVCVMKLGEIVETGNTLEVFKNPQHDYTKHLLNSQPTGRKEPISNDAEVLLDADKVSVSFTLEKNWLGKSVRELKAVNEISLKVKAGQTVGIVGESGSGKSTFGKAILRIQESKGKIEFDGKRISDMKEAALRPFKKDMQVVFQDPYGSLSPRMTVGDIIAEGLTVHFPELNRKQRLEKVRNALEEVRLPVNCINRYPHEFSGGQRQRIAIARAIILEPKFVLLDEPTSALDRSVQVTVVELLRDIQKKHNMTYLFISHDLAVIRAMSDYVVVMQRGEIVEQGTVEQIFEHPETEYTKELLSAAFDLDLVEA